MKRREKSPVIDYSKAELLEKKMILNILKHHEVEFYPLHNARDEYEATFKVRTPSPGERRHLLKDKSVRKNIDELMTLMNASSDKKLNIPIHRAEKDKDFLLDPNRAPTLRDDYFETEESFRVEEESRNLSNVKIIYTGGLLDDDHEANKSVNSQIVPYQSIQSAVDNESMGQTGAFFSIDSRGIPRFDDTDEKNRSRKSSKSPKASNESIIEALMNKARDSQLGSVQGFESLSLDQLREIKAFIEEKMHEKSMTKDPNASKTEEAFDSTQASYEKVTPFSASKQEHEQPSMEDSRRNEGETHTMTIVSLMGQIKIEEEPPESQRESIQTPSLGKGGSEAQLADAKQLMDSLKTENLNETKNFRIQDLNSFAGSRRESFATPAVQEETKSQLSVQYETKESARSGPKSNRSIQSLPPSNLSNDYRSRSRGESYNSYNKDFDTDHGKFSDDEKSGPQRKKSPIGPFKSVGISPRDDSSDSITGKYKSEGGISRKLKPKPKDKKGSKYSSKRSIKEAEEEKKREYVPTIPLEFLEQQLKDEPEEEVEEKPPQSEKRSRREEKHESQRGQYSKRSERVAEVIKLDPEDQKKVESEGPVQIEGQDGNVLITKQLFERLMPEMQYKEFLTILFKNKKVQERLKVGDLPKTQKKNDSFNEQNSSFLSDFHYEDLAMKTHASSYFAKHWTSRSNSPDSIRFSPKKVQSTKGKSKKIRFPSPYEDRKSPILEEVKEVVDSSHNSVNPNSNPRGETIKVISPSKRDSSGKRYMEDKNLPPKKLKIINISYDSSMHGMPEMSYEEEEESHSKLRNLSKENLESKRKIHELIDHGTKATSSAKKLGQVERSFKQKYLVSMGYADETDTSERKRLHNYLDPKETYKAKKMEEIAIIAKKKNAIKQYTEVSKKNADKELETIEKLQDSFKTASPTRKLRFTEMNSKDLMKYHQSVIQKAKMLQVEYTRNRKNKEKFSEYIVNKQSGYEVSHKK